MLLTWPTRRRRADRRWAGGAGILAMSVALIALPAIAVAPSLPPLVAPASNEHHAGKIIYAELVTPDIGAAKRFYGGLFGWTFRDVTYGTTTFSQAMLDGRQVAGLIGKAMPAGTHRQSAWLTFIATSDADGTARLAVSKGARMLFPPRTIPRLGREAVLADPQGAIFAILASSSGDPPDLLPDDGDWIWSSLITHDPEADAAFYKTVFGYELYDLAASGEREHLILASGSYARASANPYPADRPNAHPRWLNYVRVDDVSAATAKVAALGGRVLAPPRVDRDGDMVALVADPMGAPFGLLAWPGEQSAGSAK